MSMVEEHSTAWRGWMIPRAEQFFPSDHLRTELVEGNPQDRPGPDGAGAGSPRLPDAGCHLPHVVDPAGVREAKTSPPKPMGKWLVETLSGKIDPETPSRREPPREIPFLTHADE